MFSNIGSKIKKLAKIICWVGIAGSVIGAIVCFVSAGELGRYGAGGAMVAAGFGCLIGGPLVSWIGCFFTYGFGELIESNQQIRDMLETQSVPAAPVPPVQNPPIGGYGQPAPTPPFGGYAQPAQPMQPVQRAPRTHRAAYAPTDYNAPAAAQAYNQPRPAEAPAPRPTEEPPRAPGA